jgi:two-component sensor histidine kinase
LELESSSAAPARARRAVREEFSGRFSQEAVTNAELAASELVTNAVRYGTPGIIITVHDGDGYLHVEVEDQGTPFDPSPSDPHGGGFGLRMISTLAEEWGQTETDYGVLVWAKFSPGPSESPR